MGKIAGIIQFTGKLGETVGYGGMRGRRYIRVRRTEIKNPKSNGQNIQRMILSTVATSIGHLSNILNNSVEGRTFGGDTLAYLRGQWMRMLRTSDIAAGNDYNYNRKGDSGFAVNPYLLSKGTLPNVPVELDMVDYEILTSTNATDLSTATASQLFPNVALGNQITIIAVSDALQQSVGYCRFAFKTDEVPALLNDSGVFYINPEAIDLAKAEGAWNKLEFGLYTETSKLSITPTFIIPEAQDNLVGAAILNSNLVNNKRSTTYLTVAPEWHGQHYSSAVAYPTYGDQGTPVDVPSDVYLNNSAVVEGSGASDELRVVRVYDADGTIQPIGGVYTLDGFTEGSAVTVQFNRELTVEESSRGIRMSGQGLQVDNFTSNACIVSVQSNGVSLLTDTTLGVNLAAFEVSNIQEG